MLWKQRTNIRMKIRLFSWQQCSLGLHTPSNHVLKQIFIFKDTRMGSTMPRKIKIKIVLSWRGMERLLWLPHSTKHDLISKSIMSLRLWALEQPHVHIRVSKLCTFSNSLWVSRLLSRSRLVLSSWSGPMYIPCSGVMIRWPFLFTCWCQYKVGKTKEPSNSMHSVNILYIISI